MTGTKSPQSQQQSSHERFTEESCQSDYLRYEHTVEVSAALCYILEEDPPLATYYAFSRKLNYQRNGVARHIIPDIIGVCDNSRGFIFEIKWSLPETKQNLVSELVDLKRYFNVCSGWPPQGQRVNQHDVILLCHRDFGSRIVKEIEQLLLDEPKGYAQFNQGFAVCQWGIGFDRKEKEVIRIEKLYGQIANNELERGILGRNIPLKDLIIRRAMINFVTDSPPMQYVINQTINLINNRLFGEPFKRAGRVAVFSLEQLVRLFTKSYQRITEYSGPQIKRDWIKIACEKLVRFDYNLRRLTKDEIAKQGKNPRQEWYEAEYKIPKEAVKFICKQLVKIREREKQEAKEKEERVRKGTRKLSDFFQ